MLQVIGHLYLFLPFLKLTIFVLILVSIHGKKVIINLGVDILFDGCAAIRHHVLSLVFSQIKVHIEGSNKIID